MEKKARPRQALPAPGMVFSRLTVLEFIGPQGKENRPTWKCTCSCGNVVNVQEKRLKTGHTKSCGCIKAEGNRVTHRHSSKAAGKNGSPTYLSWLAMIQRCNTPSCSAYPLYGAKGIKVCDEWLKFESFLADMGERPKGKTLDRIDSTGHYEPGNCRWATAIEQANNKGDNRLFEFDGKTQTLGRWSADLGLPYHTLYARIVTRGWSVEKALTTPQQKRPHHV